MSDDRQQTLDRAARLAVRTDSMLGIDIILIEEAPVVEEGEMSGPNTEPRTHREPVISKLPDQKSRAPAAVATPISLDDSYFDESTSQQSRLARLQEHHASTCAHQLRNGSDCLLVFGEGAPDASLMFVGDAPGTEEERHGRPFVGRSGSKLDEMIKAMGLRRDDVYITNALKYRPVSSGAHDPVDVEICEAFLSAQVRIVKPDVIVALGGPAAKLLLKTDMGITSLRGQWKKYEGAGHDVSIMPTFHPAYLLRNPTVEVRGQVWADLQLVMKALELPMPSGD